MLIFSSIATSRRAFRRTMIAGAVLLATCFLFPRLQTANAAAATSDFRRLNNGMRTDAAKGVADTKAFLAQDTTMPFTMRVLLEDEMARIYCYNLKDPKSALEVLDSGMAEVDKAPAGPNQDHARSRLVVAKAKIETSQGENQQATDLIDSNMPMMLKIINTDGNSAIVQEGLMIDARALGSLKQGQKIVPILQKALLAYPEFMADSEVTGQLVNNLMAEGNGAEALSYAKLAWMVCPFDTKSLQNATNLLTTSWLATDLNAGEGNAFIAAQKDSTLPNPLTPIKLPTWDAAVLASSLTDIPASATHDRITLLLMQGKMGDAMLVARRGLLEHPSSDNSEAILEMARVFKAADLNLVRANAFLQYFQSGKGTNPLDDFFKQYPAETAAK